MGKTERIRLISHLLNFLRYFQKRFEREPTRGALKDNLIFLLSCPFFMMLQLFSILMSWNNDSLKKAVRTFFPSNCNFSVNIEPIIVCFSSMPQSVLPPGRFLTKEIQFLYRYVSQYFVLLLLPCLQSISSRHWPFIFAACFQIYGV